VADAGLSDGANPATTLNPCKTLRNTMTQTATIVEIGAEDMPLHCPTANTPAWNYHPRVFLDVADTGEVKCPYCGTVYKLKPGTVLKGHH